MFGRLNIAAKIAAVTVLAVLGRLVIGALVYSAIDTPEWVDAPTLAESLPVTALGTLLIVLALVLPVKLSRFRGFRLFVALFAAIVGLNVLLTNIEAAVFLIMGPNQLFAAALDGALRAALLAALMVAAFGSRDREEHDPVPAVEGLSTFRWTRRVLSTSVIYVVLYFVAGILILPFVEDFYATQNLEVGPWFLPLQVLRGALYIASVVYLLRSLEASRLQVALAMAFMFPMLAGVPDLLGPNPVMPTAVRYWHLLEIGWSNAVFGLIVGYRFWRPLRATLSTEAGAGHPPAPHQAAA